MAQGSSVHTSFFTNALDNDANVIVETRTASVLGKVKNVFADGVAIEQEPSGILFDFKFQDILIAEEICD